MKRRFRTVANRYIYSLKKMNRTADRRGPAGSVSPTADDAAGLKEKAEISNRNRSSRTEFQSFVAGFSLPISPRVNLEIRLKLALFTVVTSPLEDRDLEISWMRNSIEVYDRWAVRSAAKKV